MINQISSGMQPRSIMIKPQAMSTKGHQIAMTAPKAQYDKVSFGGINSAAKLANSEGIAKAVAAAREVVGKKHKDVSKLVSSAVQEVMTDGAGEAVKKLSEKNTNILSSLQAVAKDAKTAVKGAKAEEVTAKAMEVVNSALGDYKAVEGGKFLKSKGLHKFLELANTNQAVFSAMFALGLAGVLRPATIYALPAKNKDDNAYAAGHSISSGLIGFAASLLINAPVAKAVKNVKANANDYLKPETIKNMGKVVDGQLTGKNVDIATRYLNMIPEIGFAIPKACVTVALVPFLLKNVFGLEKGKGKNAPKAEQPQVAQNQPAKGEDKKVSFGAAAPDAKKVGLIQKALSKAVAGVMNFKPAQKLFEKTANSDVNIVKHLSALNGLIISGMYVVKTLQNDKLDPERKPTLAINQAAVSVVSTVLGYTFDKVANKKVDKVIEKFQAANMGKGAEKLAEYAGGIKAAASMMIFGTVYRYISPVLVTPIANKLGNIVADRKAQKAQQA